MRSADLGVLIVTLLRVEEGAIICIKNVLLEEGRREGAIAFEVREILVVLESVDCHGRCQRAGDPQNHGLCCLRSVWISGNSDQSVQTRSVLHSLVKHS